MVNRRFLRSVLATAGVTFTLQANATLETTGSVTIAQIIGYSDYGSGDVIFTATAGTASCSGFWLRPSDAGFRTLYAMLMTAYVAQTPLTISAYTDSIWNGSASTFCRVYDLAPKT
jgi:hypothetical protein